MSSSLAPQPTCHSRLAYQFTVFTATYNRAHALPRVYQSLCAQTFRDFEWLIVDDGSTDATSKLVEKWQQASGFSIRYIYQQHGGKHIAFNRGVREASGEFFLSLDSDDACIPEALERFKQFWEGIPESDKGRFSAVTALCADQHGKLIGDNFPREVLDCSAMEMRYRYRVRGDKWGFHRTEVLKEFPFPELEGVSHVPEDVVWNAIDRKYKTRFVNCLLRVYFRNESSASDQLTRHRNPAARAPAFLLWRKMILNHEIDWFLSAPIHFVMAALHYSRYSFHVGMSTRGQLAGLDNLMARALWLLALPVGYLAYLRDKRFPCR
jgi:glycosyltransferase involved in cell wall biosynthesis